ncbi:MAG: aminotransferase class I/II-fold pyridoxal phosphate-dependent enzyme [Planctomycetaceae bacterium]
MAKVEAAITDKTKLICNSPANPTGTVGGASEMEALAKLAKEKEIVLISDEIYRSFCYDDEFSSPTT